MKSMISVTVLATLGATLFSLPASSQDSSPVVSGVVLEEAGESWAYATVESGDRSLEDVEVSVNDVPLEYGIPVSFLVRDETVPVEFTLPIYRADLSGQALSQGSLDFRAARGGKTLYERKGALVPGPLEILEEVRSPWDPRIARARWSMAENAEDYLFERTDDPDRAMQVLALGGDVDLLSMEPETSRFLTARVATKAGEPPVAEATPTGRGAPRVRGAVEQLQLIAEPDKKVEGIKFRVHRNNPEQIQAPGGVDIKLKLHSGKSAAFVMAYDMNQNQVFRWFKVRVGSGKSYRIHVKVPPGALVVIGRNNTSLRGETYSHD